MRGWEERGREGEGIWRERGKGCGLVGVGGGCMDVAVTVDVTCMRRANSASARSLAFSQANRSSCTSLINTLWLLIISIVIRLE